MHQIDLNAWTKLPMGALSSGLARWLMDGMTPAFVRAAR